MKKRPILRHIKKKQHIKIKQDIKHHAKKHNTNARHTVHIKRAVHKPTSHIDMLKLVSSGGPNVTDTTHLSRYVERSLKNGVEKERIIGLCLQAGWTKQEIDAAFVKAKSIRSKIHSFKDHVMGRNTGVEKHVKPRATRLRPSAQKIFAVALIISLLAYAIFFGNILKRDCGNDIDCFDKLAAKCAGAKLEALKDANTYEYTIKGKIGNDCMANIKLKNMALGTPVNIVEKLEGKYAECKIPRALLVEKGMNDIEDLLSYCSGNLKESVYEVIMDDMYTLIIKNMGNITKMVEKDLSKFSAQAL